MGITGLPGEASGWTSAGGVGGQGEPEHLLGGHKALTQRFPLVMAGVVSSGRRFI